MYLVQLLIPVRDELDVPFPRSLYNDLTTRLTDAFGGVTGYTRAPAAGLWDSEAGERVRDDVIVYEVMAETLDLAWWSKLRSHLETAFRQEEVVIRAMEMRKV